MHSAKWLGRLYRLMRLDKYLKVSRLIKRRTIANEACDGERVSVNGRKAKASYEVKPGDTIEVRFGQRMLKVEVLSVSEHTTKADAPAMYREIGA
jgi:ribosomal 50S subunit-recycling heat shock protein